MEPGSPTLLWPILTLFGENGGLFVGARESDLEDDLWNDIITIVGDLSSYLYL